MLVIEDASRCCGCEACVQKCPRNCIEMKADREGFFYPTVDTSECIECGLCNKVCPMQTKSHQDYNAMPKAYAAFVRDDEIRRKSSSFYSFGKSGHKTKWLCVWSSNVKGLQKRFPYRSTKSVRISSNAWQQIRSKQNTGHI